MSSPFLIERTGAESLVSELLFFEYQKNSGLRVAQ